MDMAVDVPSPEETIERKRVTLERIQSDDDEPATKYWRADDK